MRTKEFINKVKELDYGCTIDGHYIVVVDDYRSLVTISQYKMYYITMETDDDKLGELSYEYAQTPIEEREIEEREEEKKYYLRLKDDFYKITYAYLTRDIQNGDYFSFGKHELKGTQNRFTQKEIDEIKKKYNTDLLEFKQIEVEE